MREIHLPGEDGPWVCVQGCGILPTLLDATSHKRWTGHAFVRPSERVDAAPVPAVPRNETPTGDEELLAELERLNEAAKVVGNRMWERGPEWHDLANTVYRGAKQLWIAQGVLGQFVKGRLSSGQRPLVGGGE